MNAGGSYRFILRCWRQTHRLIEFGVNVIAGFEIDPTCQYTYEHNNHVEYRAENIRVVKAF